MSRIEQLLEIEHPRLHARLLAGPHALEADPREVAALERRDVGEHPASGEPSSCAQVQPPWE